jgi:hypothetical protein
MFATSTSKKKEKKETTDTVIKINNCLGAPANELTQTG